MPRIKHFFWLCHHGSIPVRQVPISRGISCNTGCPLCHRQEESISHALRDCPVARKFWVYLGVPQAFANFLCLNLLDCLKENSVCSPHIKANGIPWSVQFPFAIWSLWKHRNRVTFENTSINTKLHQVCKQEAREYYCCVGKGQKLKHRIVTPVCWVKPPLGWYKLTLMELPWGILANGKAGGGGLIRDHQGKWIKEFMRSCNQHNS